MEELRECPFCGADDISVWDKSRYDVCVRCANCNSQTDWLPTIADAVTAWNARHDNCQNCTEVKAEHEMYLRVCEVVSAQKRLIDKLKNCRKLKGDES